MIDTVDSIDSLDSEGYAVARRAKLMNMEDPLRIASELEPVCSFLESTGKTELARKVGEAIAAFRAQAPVVAPPGGVMTTGEAAAALGIRSVNTIKRWVHDGELEGFRLGGRILVSKRSVQRLTNKPTVAHQRIWEEETDRALATVDAMDEKIPATAAPWQGRKPWENDGSEKTEPTTPKTNGAA